MKAGTSKFSFVQLGDVLMHFAQSCFLQLTTGIIISDHNFFAQYFFNSYISQNISTSVRGCQTFCSHQRAPNLKAHLYSYMCKLASITFTYTFVQTSTSGVASGLVSVSCPRTLRHTDQGNWTSDLPIPRCWLYPWATAAHVMLSTHSSVHVYFYLLMPNLSSYWKIKAYKVMTY